MLYSFRRLLAAVCVGLLAGCQLVHARSAVGDRVLVVIEPKLSKSDYSLFWTELQERGFDLTFRAPKDDKPTLVVHDVPQFEHLIVFAPSTKTFHESLSPQAIVAVQTAHQLNTLFLASPSLSEQSRDFAREYDVEFEPRDHVLIDYFSNSSDPSSVVISSESSFFKSPATSGLKLPILYPNGVAHKLGLNPLLLPVLSASESAFSGEIVELDVDEREVEAATGGKNKEVLAGAKAALVSGFQTRDNARVGWIGSVEMLSDRTLKSKVDVDGKKSANGNAAFLREFTSWVFQETGVIKVIGSTHHKAGETAPREMYRIKDELTYELTLTQHSTSSNKTSRWVPFTTTDLQVDFTMLDPHIRTSLHSSTSSPSTTSTTYSATFKAPDKHGVFKFVVEYWRPGYSCIRSSSTAPIVPFRHDEYPRFIVGAWPYYLSTGSVVLAFGLFCALWLSIAEDRARGGKKTE